MRIALPIRPLQRWLAVLFLLVACLGLVPAAQATHLAAGDIQTRTDPKNPRHIFFTLSLYVRVPVPGQVAEEKTVTIFFGDGTSQQDIPFVSQTQVAPEYLLSIFKFEHTYNSNGYFPVGYASVNRPVGVLNMSNSSNESFYIGTTILIDPFTQNTSPQLLAPAIDKGSVEQVFLHNPAAYDAEGDSLAYELQPSRKAGNPIDAIANGNKLLPTPTTGFTYPNNLAGVDARQVAYNGPPVGVPGDKAIFSIDARTGQIVWNAPAQVGVYNVAFVVREYRRSPGTKVPLLLSETIRDMQIIVKEKKNLRPIINVPPDVCVVANTPVPGGTITATDPDGNPVLLEAFTGLLPTPASFKQNTKGPPVARALFQWTPDCSYIRRQPYSVLFKATDEPGGSISPLIDERIWNITVVGPAPQNLRSTLQGSNVRLDWDSYSCQNPGAQMLIFRREGCFPYTPTTCQTGLPAGSGYVQIGSVGAGTRTFLDDNNGQGLTKGKTYSYRIYVKFAEPSGGESLASNEACIKVEGRSPRLTNVTVDRTDPATGQITVRWNQPAPLSNFSEPRGYRLYRATGQNPAPTDFRKVYSTTNLRDTTFVNTGLNTTDNAYTYRLDFFSNQTLAADSVERTAPASSVRLTATPNPLASTVAVSWTYKVPWDNTKRPTTVYRREPGGAFRPVGKVTGTTTGGQFVDDGKVLPLVKNRTYCYYVKTNGTYDITLPDSLINLSQEQCAPLQAVPCTPILTLKPTNCDSLASRLFDLPKTDESGMVFTNYLSWTLGNQPENCSRDIVQYVIYYAPTEAAALTELARVPGTQTTYLHANLASAQGCYAVQAIDRNGAVSALSNKECKDNCLLFLLPNIFTPNGDRVNDTFRPKVFSPIERTVVKIYNRWGTKVYEGSQDPLINWNGGGTGEGNSNGKVSDGMYFYQADVTFKDANRTTRSFKGWVQINR